MVPVVLRARGFRLYTDGGKRLVDLWLNGGAAILGHTPPNMLREIKNTASRGLYAPFPHFTESRFLKALSKLLPGYYFRLYAAPPLGFTAPLWRPFEATPAQLFIPVLPGIQTWRNDLPLGLCVAAAKNENELLHLPLGDILPPILLAIAARGIHDILASPERAKPKLPRTFKVLREQTDKTWQRRGIYLYPGEKPAPEVWSALFHQFLEAGFLLPPTPSQPVILPGELSDGEDAKLASVLHKCVLHV
jgi:hypothetical protein